MVKLMFYIIYGIPEIGKVELPFNTVLQNTALDVYYKCICTHKITVSTIFRCESFKLKKKSVSKPRSMRLHFALLMLLYDTESGQFDINRIDTEIKLSLSV